MTILTEVSELLGPVYLVGGSVRDQLIGKVPKDYDFTTPLSPDEIEQRVRTAGRHPYLIGKRFGTVGFKLDGKMVEVTTFRQETYVPGSRKPAVEFVEDITADLSRRDFTINAIAMRVDGSLVDPWGGRLDLVSKTIKAVGKPADRYKEDPLRMLRAARLASQLGFAVEQNTESAALKYNHRILMVSRERWVQELDKLLVSDKPSIGLDLLARTRLLNYMLPELAQQVGYDQESPYHDLTLWEHTLSTVDLAPRDITMRWAALLHDVGKPAARTRNKAGYCNYIKHDLIGAGIAVGIGQRLKWSNERCASVADLVLNHMTPDSPIREADNASKTRLPEGAR